MFQYLKRRIYTLRIMAGVRRKRDIARAALVTFAEGFTILTYPWLFDDNWEAAERETMARLIPRHDVFVDVGANHGFYAAMADHLGKAALAIEPEPTNLAILRENANGRRISVFPCALGEEPGTLELFGEADSASLQSEWLGERYLRQRVDVRTLDQIVEEAGVSGTMLIKIDVEGVEDKVLAGATKTLSRPSTWIVETMRTMPSGKPCGAFEPVFEIMKANGFEGRLIAGADRNWLFERR